MDCCWEPVRFLGFFGILPIGVGIAPAFFCFGFIALNSTAVKGFHYVFSFHCSVNGMDQLFHAFFFEGEQVQSLAGGLEMRGTFMRNPGMVVN